MTHGDVCLSGERGYLPSRRRTDRGAMVGVLAVRFVLGAAIVAAFALVVWRPRLDAAREPR
jgi:hypothetical protein